MWSSVSTFMKREAPLSLLVQCTYIWAFQVQKMPRRPTRPCVSNGHMTFWFQLPLVVALTNCIRRIVCEKLNAVHAPHHVAPESLCSTIQPCGRPCGMLSIRREEMLNFVQNRVLLRAGRLFGTAFRTGSDSRQHPLLNPVS